MDDGRCEKRHSFHGHPKSNAVRRLLRKGLIFGKYDNLHRIYVDARVTT